MCIPLLAVKAQLEKMVIERRCNMFYFVRHGKTDYSERNTKIYQGFGVNLSKLSEEGKSDNCLSWYDDTSDNGGKISCLWGTG